MPIEPSRTPNDPTRPETAASGPATLSADTLRRLYEATGISVWIYDASENRFAHTALGPRSRGLPQGATTAEVMEHLHPDDRRRVRRRIRQCVREGVSGSVQCRTNPARGPIRHLAATYFADGDSLPVARITIILQDVSVTVRTEAELRESLAHYANAQSLHPEIPWVADPDGSIIEAGPRWASVVGGRVEDALGFGWAKALHPEDAAEALALWAEHLRSGEPVDLEYRMRLQDGSYHWMRARAAPQRDARGRIERWYGTLEDVHEQHLATIALRESEQFARSILESSGNAIEVLDAEGRLIFINGPGAKLMEVEDVERIYGRPFDTFWPGDVKPAVQDAIRRAQGGETVRRTLFGPTAKGSARWWDITISPVLDADGKASRLLALSSDVTAAKRNEVAVVATARRLEDVLESTMDAVVSVDRCGKITYANKHATATVPGELVLGRDLWELAQQLGVNELVSSCWAAMEKETQFEAEEYVASLGRWFEVRARGRSDGLTVFFRDVTERRQAQQQIERLARHDALTDLANRSHFQDRLMHALASAGEAGVAVMVIDLDDFKLVNDTLGHQAGDRLLQQTASRIVDAAGPQAVVARLGGDEFALVMPCGDPAGVAERAQAIVERVCEPLQIDGETVSIGASIGIALAPGDATESDALLRCADMALYRVKDENGRNFRFYEMAMDHAVRDRREMKRDLALALSRNELSVWYQPQLAVGSNRIVGFEALLRWRHPVRGDVPPGQFVPLAEESGLIGAIGAFVLGAACAEAVHWPSDMTVSVNLSLAQFRSPEFATEVLRTLERTGLAPTRLELEITESTLLDESSGAIAALKVLQEAGAKVALDDFGTGYASLSYLRRLPFDRIKIDRSFVAGVPTSADSAAIVHAVIGLAQALGMRVTAEGVERFDQLAFLAREGCHDAQGFLFSPPLPGAQARQLANGASLGGWSDGLDRRMYGERHSK